MGIYGDTALEYFENGLYVTPTRGKMPYCKNWHRKELYNDYENFVNRHKYANGIGLLTGEINNIIIVDIDTKDKELQQKIIKLLPPTPVMKTGDKDKAANYFYKYNGESKKIFKDKNGNVAVEILSTGQQSIMPPTIHVNGYPYEWVGANLFNDLELPILNKKTLMELDSLFNQESTFGGNIGRNNTLVQITTAKFIQDEKDFQTVVDEIQEYDLTNHNPPLFTDCKEKQYSQGSSLLNATIFAGSVLKSLKQNGKIIQLPKVENKVDIKIVEKDKTKNRDMKLPKASGILQELFELTYKNIKSPRSKLILPSLITFFGTLLANRIKFDGIYTNFYTLLVSNSGFGKTNIFSFLQDMMIALECEDLIGLNDPASDVAVIAELEQKRQRLDIIEEGAKLFRNIKAGNTPHLNNIGEVYSELYTVPGHLYLGRTALGYKQKYGKNTIGRCKSPCVSLITAVTPRIFRKLFSYDVLEQGFGGRFFYTTELEFKKSSYVNNTIELNLDLEPLKTIKEKIFKLSIFNFTNELTPVEIRKSDKINSKIEEIYNDVEILREKTYKDNNSKTFPILNRYFELFKRIVLIDAVSSQLHERELHEIEILQSNLDYALDLLDVHMKRVDEFFEYNFVASSQEGEVKDIEKIIKKLRVKGITKSDLYKKGINLGLTGKRLNEILNMLQEAGIIIQTKEKTKGRLCNRYFHSENIDT